MQQYERKNPHECYKYYGKITELKEATVLSLY